VDDLEEESHKGSSWGDNTHSPPVASEQARLDSDEGLPWAAG